MEDRASVPFSAAQTHPSSSSDKFRPSAVRLQAQPGFLVVEGQVGQDAGAILQPLQLSPAVQLLKVLGVDGYPVLPQPAEEGAAALPGPEALRQLPPPPPAGCTP